MDIHVHVDGGYCATRARFCSVQKVSGFCRRRGVLGGRRAGSAERATVHRKSAGACYRHTNPLPFKTN
eukprot:6549224-Pyramimonas_sp.AAC.1